MILEERTEKKLHDERVKIFQDHVEEHIPVPGLGMYLSMHGFFDAPASTKYHGAYPGGLFDHSLNVMNALVYLTDDNHLRWGRKESPYIIGFLHDICKMDQYKKISGEYVGDPFHYEYDKDTLYQGHGEKSLMILSTLLVLTEEEAACIRYHMGAFTEKEQWNDYTRAIHHFPNVLWTHHADMLAAHVVEVDT